jgi:hypothetical protein
MLVFKHNARLARHYRSKGGFVAARKESEIKKEVFIACPVCFSGNSFQLEEREQELACVDCGFALTESSAPNLSEPEECIFCRSSHFYFEAPLDLSFLGRASICYVCEARYKGVVINDPEEKYIEEGALRARMSEAALRWKKKVEQHHQQAVE